MKTFIRQELLYGIKSKKFLYLIVLLSLLFIIINYLNYSAAIENYENYNNTIAFEKENGTTDKDIEALLASDYSLTEENASNKFTTITIIDNPLPYYKMLISQYAYTLNPHYVVAQLLETSAVYFPLVFGMLGLITATSDFKYNTLKLRTVRVNKTVLSIAKQTSLLMSCLIIIVVSLLLGYIVSWVMYAKLGLVISLSDFTFANVDIKSTIGIKFLYGYIIAIFFAEIGYTLGVVFKNMIIGLIGIAAYIMFIPLLGKFDLRNIMYFFGEKIFDYYGMITIEKPLNLSATIAVLFIILIIIISIVINMVLTAMRSSYNC